MLLVDAGNYGKQIRWLGCLDPDYVIRLSGSGFSENVVEIRILTSGIVWVDNEQKVLAGSQISHVEGGGAYVAHISENSKYM